MVLQSDIDQFFASCPDVTRSHFEAQACHSTQPVNKSCISFPFVLTHLIIQLTALVEGKDSSNPKARSCAFLHSSAFFTLDAAGYTP